MVLGFHGPLITKTRCTAYNKTSNQANVTYMLYVAVDVCVCIYICLPVSREQISAENEA